jgi:hypothetical protein
MQLYFILRNTHCAYIHSSLFIQSVLSIWQMDHFTDATLSSKDTFDSVPTNYDQNGNDSGFSCTIAWAPPSKYQNLYSGAACSAFWTIAVNLMSLSLQTHPMLFSSGSFDSS